MVYLGVVGLTEERRVSKEKPSHEFLEQLASHSPRGARYLDRGEIARGGMGAILEVWDQDLRRPLAMKVIHNAGRGAEREDGGGKKEGSGGAFPGAETLDASTLSRFLEEAQVTGQLEHPGIVPIHELGLDDQGRLYYTMPLIEGATLKEIFDRIKAGDREWSEVRALGVLLRACEAVAFAHSRGVIHRDLKPENIMIGRFGEVYVMDWGLAKNLVPESSAGTRSTAHHAPRREPSVSTERSDSQRSNSPESMQTLDGDVMGTPAYMSPEQAQGEVDRLGPPADVYAMGAILYQLMAGFAPHMNPESERNSADVLMDAMRRAPSPLSEVANDTSPELVEICEKAMQREPSDRFSDLLEMATAIRGYLESGVGRARAALQSSRLVRILHFLLGASWWILLLVVVMIVALVFLPTDGATFDVDVPMRFQFSDPEFGLSPASTMVSSASVSDLQGKVKLASSEDVFKWVALVPAIGLLFFVMLILRSSRKIVRTLRDGNPFLPANVRRIRWLGFLFLLQSLISSSYSTFGVLLVRRWIEFEDIVLKTTVKIHFTPLFFGLLLFVLAEVFRLGAELVARNRRLNAL